MQPETIPRLSHMNLARIALYMAPAVFAGVLLTSISHYKRAEPDSVNLAPTVPYGSPLASLGGWREPALDLDQVDVPVPFELRWGQTLTDLFGELGLDRGASNAAVFAAAEHLDVRRVRAGESGAGYYDASGQLARLSLGIAGKGRLELARSGESWSSDWQASVRRTERRHIQGVLEDALIPVIRQAGGHPTVAYKMSDVLQWDLDFHRDLRAGDRFQVLYEDLYVDGESRGAESILALRYENRGQVYEAYRFGENGFYYDANGKPLRKMFLRSPMTFSRVTSRFSHRRFHPVLKVHRPHYGVDYGAPTGTPARVTASGTVIFAGWTKGGGKTVKVRHPNGYVTAYLHLSRYGEGVRTGKTVRQEQIIGYVGSTGLATGPHLDYRVQKNGRWIDPLKLPNTPADSISADEMPRFLAQRDELRQRLSGGWSGGRAGSPSTSGALGQ